MIPNKWLKWIGGCLTPALLWTACPCRCSCFEPHNSATSILRLTLSAPWPAGLWEHHQHCHHHPPLHHHHHHHHCSIKHNHTGLFFVNLTGFICILSVQPEPPQNLRVFNATITTLTAKWDPAPGPVQNYKITYEPTAGGDPITVSSFILLLSLKLQQERFFRYVVA